MPRVFAVCNLHHVVRRRAGADRLDGRKNPAAGIAVLGFPLPPIAFRLSGMHVGQPRRLQCMGQRSADHCQPQNMWRRPSADGPLGNCKPRLEARDHSSADNASPAGARFSQAIGEFRQVPLERFSPFADDKRTEAQILRRLHGRTRGLNACR